jgi:universal stress protein F
MYKHILVPVDPSHGEVGERIVSVARFLAGADGKVSLLTVLEPVPAMSPTTSRGDLEKIHGDAKAQLEALARSAGSTSTRCCGPARRPT